MPKIVVLTGAGISAESGVPTFRAADGLWEGHRIEDVATPEGFAADPALVHEFYDQRRAALSRVAPNPAHAALSRLEAALGDDFLLVTQNIDDLHERAGSERVIHMHGELLNSLCAACGARSPWSGPMLYAPACEACGADALRPDVVWFGEMPYRMEEIDAALEEAETFVSIGTSGKVYPAAGFVMIASGTGSRTIEINLEPSDGASYFHDTRHGRAGDLVPIWVDEVLG